MQTHKKRATQNTTQISKRFRYPHLREFVCERKKTHLAFGAVPPNRLVPSSPFALKDHLRGVTSATRPSRFR